MAAALSLLLGFPLHLAAYSVRHRWNTFTVDYYFQRMHSCFQHPVSRKHFFGIGSPIDALEWGLIATAGALGGLGYYVLVRTRRHPGPDEPDDR